MGGRGDAGCEMNVRAPVVALARVELRHARVDTHAHTDRLTARAHCALAGDRGVDRVLPVAEGNEEAVALGRYLDPTVRPPNFAQHVAMGLEHVAVAAAQLGQKPGRPLDVGEQERHRPRGKPLGAGDRRHARDCRRCVLAWQTALRRLTRGSGML